MSSETATAMMADSEQISIINTRRSETWDLLVREWWYDYDHLLVQYPSGKIDCFGEKAFVVMGE